MARLGVVGGLSSSSSTYVTQTISCVQNQLVICVVTYDICGKGADSAESKECESGVLVKTHDVQLSQSGGIVGDGGREGEEVGMFLLRSGCS